MRTLDQCFHRQDGQALNHGAAIFREEGRGLGFSIGGWHPFQINTYLPTLKKLDPLANTSLGKAVWKPIEKLNTSVNKDFAKAKTWSQEHRKQLQIAAAIAAGIVTAGVATGYFAGAEGAAAAAAAGEGATAAAAGEAVATSATLVPEALAPLATSAAPSLSLVPAAVGGGEAVTTAATLVPETLAPLATSAAPSLSLVPMTAPSAGLVTSSIPALTAGGGSSILGTVGSIAGTATSLTPLLALGKVLGITGQPQAQGSTGYDSGGGYGYGYGASGGGGGSLGPLAPMGPPDSLAPSAAQPLPAWVAPAAIAGILVYLIKR